jgi:maltose alpha-D-glucosyltransferase/alpha-amylase
MERAIRVRKEWPEFGWGEWKILGTGRREVLAHLVTWDGGRAMAVHNFSDKGVRVTARVPERGEGEKGKWRHVFGVGGEAPPLPVKGGRLSVDLPPYGYHWFGMREGV